MLKRLVWDFSVNTLAKSILTPTKLRYSIYKAMGLKILSSNIRSGVTFRGKNVVIEKGVFINHDVFIDCMEKVVIGENSALAFQVMLCTSTHQIGDVNRRQGESVRLPITIGKGCWLGARTTVLPGVTIGDGCIIAAGATVTKDCEPNGLYAGTPARRVKDLPVGEYLQEVAATSDSTVRQE